MDNNNRKDKSYKHALKLEPPTHGKLHEIIKNPQTRQSVTPIFMNLISPLNIEKKIDSKTSRKSSFTPIYLKDFNLNVNNRDSRPSTTRLYPEDITYDENKFILDSTDNKGVFYNI